jgi:sortase A
MRKAHWLTWLGSALIIGGATLLGLYCGVRHRADRAQADAQQWLNHTAKTRRPYVKIPNFIERRPRYGDVVGELTVARLHLSVMVLEGDDDAILRRGAGHLPATALPQDGGNVGIAAHRDTYFRPLRLIRPNDAVALTTPLGTIRYTVTNVEVVQPSDIQVLESGPGRDLTLVTCYPFYYFGSAPQRFIVHAKRNT